MKTTILPDAASLSDPTSTGAALDQVAQGAHEIVDKVTDLISEALRQAKPAATQFAHHAIDDAAAGAVPVAAWFDEHADEMNTTQAQLIDDARKYIRENPLTSIGIALAIGFIISRSVR